MFSSKDEKYLSDAIEEAHKHTSDLKTDYTLCAILKTKKDIYYGYNQKKTHPLQKEFSKNPHALSLHAEIDAIRQAYSNEGNISKSTLYVARTLMDGTPANACPCSGCQEAIFYFGIDQVFFTTSTNYGELKNA